MVHQSVTVQTTVFWFSVHLHEICFALFCFLLFSHNIQYWVIPILRDCFMALEQSNYYHNQHLTTTYHVLHQHSRWSTVNITTTSYWARWRLKSPASRLFTQSFIRAQIKENIKAPRHWPLCREFTGDRWIPHTKGQLRGKCFHLMTSSWSACKQRRFCHVWFTVYKKC